MQERKINLEEVIAKNAGYIGNDYYVSQVKKAMFEFGKQLLELAAENATTKSVVFISGRIQNTTEIVYKQSILDTIKQVE